MGARQRGAKVRRGRPKLDECAGDAERASLTTRLTAAPSTTSSCGEPWHRAGQVPNRQRSIVDFIACARYLIDKKNTVSSKLGIDGASQGGALVGNGLVQQPGLLSFAIAQSGVLHLLGDERTANGPPQAPELGTSRTRTGFANLYKMSPYQHVVNGTAYPAVLLTTGSNDPRVLPWIVTKMAARL